MWYFQWRGQQWWEFNEFFRWGLSSTITSKKVRKNNKRLPALSEIADRSHVSDRVAASLANAAIKNLGLISQEDNTMVFERSIFADKGKKTGWPVLKELGKVQGLYLGGKRDDTLTRDVVFYTEFYLFEIKICSVLDKERLTQLQPVVVPFELIGTLDSVFIRLIPARRGTGIVHDPKSLA